MTSNIWKRIATNILCVQFSFCLLRLQFYFVNYVIITCELYYDNSLEQQRHAKKLQIIQSNLDMLTCKQQNSTNNIIK